MERILLPPRRGSPAVQRHKQRGRFSRVVLLVGPPGPEAVTGGYYEIDYRNSNQHFSVRSSFRITETSMETGCQAHARRSTTACRITYRRPFIPTVPFWSDLRSIPDTNTSDDSRLPVELHLVSKRKEKIRALLKGIETGDPAAVAVVSSETYIQHNP